jgi:ATP-binding cassette subfamily F protein 3
MLFRLSDITKSYGGYEVLKGVSFQVNPGEKVGLVGRNGTGKTTLFRIITGQESADTGEVHKLNNLKLGLLEQHVDFALGETVHTAALSAFKKVHDIEAEMRSLESQMVTDHSEAILSRYADLQLAFEQADGFTYAARAESVLMGLGFAKENWDLQTNSLSGGQKNRLGMARLLLSSPDILLLDEPTNHLDVQAVEWLESFLQSYDGSYVVISHDRYFLDRTTNRIIEIENGRAVTYKGNYSDYLEEREIRREQQQRTFENQQAMIAKTQEFIRRNLEGQKTKQAKSRRNMLERMERVEAVASEKHGGSFGLKKVERTGNNVRTTEELAIGYGKKPLAGGINLSLHRGEAMGIIGGNGTGKTTFLKTILGEIPELGGKIFWGTKVDFGYYSQNLENLAPQNEIIQELRRVAPLAESGELRSFLARFLFFGEDVCKRVADLSGGEKGRLALAKLIYSRKNVLVLDEPTNHLDIPAREALEAALDEYDGTIITVSHDRYFLDRIATQILAFTDDSSVETIAGNYTEYHDWRDAKNAAAPTSSAGVARSRVSTVAIERGQAGEHEGVKTAHSKLSGVDDAKDVDGRPEQASTLSKNQRTRLEARIKELESLIPELEDDAAKLTLEMSTPEMAADFERLSSLTNSHRELTEKIQSLYAEWEKAAEALE